MLALQKSQPALLFDAFQRDRPAFGELQKVRGMALPRSFTFAFPVELSERKLPDGLEHAVARLLAALIDAHQALVDQRAEAVEDVQLSGRVHHGVRRLEGPAADEDAEASKERLLPGREQVVAPGDRVAQRPLSRRRIARPARQQGQPLLQPGRQLLCGEQLDARSREFDRQGNAVCPMTDGRNCPGILLREREPRISRCGPCREKRNRRGVLEFGQRR